ncbi:Uncharacterised protein [Candidatus Tiddalikarchaeum anstoanum]|nr:Uncharacterised protein [Candidatus Tiddalikarchaeum anstoanum]
MSLKLRFKTTISSAVESIKDENVKKEYTNIMNKIIPQLESNTFQEFNAYFINTISNCSSEFSKTKDYTKQISYLNKVSSVLEYIKSDKFLPVYEEHVNSGRRYEQLLDTILKGDNIETAVEDREKSKIEHVSQIKTNNILPTLNSMLNESELQQYVYSLLDADGRINPFATIQKVYDKMQISLTIISEIATQFQLLDKNVDKEVLEKLELFRSDTSNIYKKPLAKKNEEVLNVFAEQTINGLVQAILGVNKNIITTYNEIKSVEADTLLLSENSEQNSDKINVNKDKIESKYCEFDSEKKDFFNVLTKLEKFIDTSIIGVLNELTIEIRKYGIQYLMLSKEKCFVADNLGIKVQSIVRTSTSTSSDVKYHDYFWKIKSDSLTTVESVLEDLRKTVTARSSELFIEKGKNQFNAEVLSNILKNIDDYKLDFGVEGLPVKCMFYNYELSSFRKMHDFLYKINFAVYEQKLDENIKTDIKKLLNVKKLSQLDKKTVENAIKLENNSPLISQALYKLKVPLPLNLKNYQSEEVAGLVKELDLELKNFEKSINAKKKSIDITNHLELLDSFLVRQFVALVNYKKPTTFNKIIDNWYSKDKNRLAAENSLTAKKNEMSIVKNKLADLESYISTLPDTLLDNIDIFPIQVENELLCSLIGKQAQDTIDEKKLVKIVSSLEEYRVECKLSEAVAKNEPLFTGTVDIKVPARKTTPIVKTNLIPSPKIPGMSKTPPLPKEPGIPSTLKLPPSPKEPATTINESAYEPVFIAKKVKKLESDFEDSQRIIAYDPIVTENGVFDTILYLPGNWEKTIIELTNKNEGKKNE